MNPTLVVRRSIRATPQRLFAAWTEPAQLLAWWGPGAVTCTHAEIDLRVGGRYRLANQMPDGKVVWIAGTFELITPPRKLVYTWGTGSNGGETERVTVAFEPGDGATEVVIVHERIADAATRKTHEHGWRGCLESLAAHLATEHIATG